MPSPTENFVTPSNLEHSKSRIKKNRLDFSRLESTILRRSRDSTFIKRELMGKTLDRKKIYDDDLTETISEMFNDRTRTIPILGDIIRALHLSIRRKDITFEEFLKMSIDKESRVTRFDIAQLTKIDSIRLNSMSIFMNGGPTGEYWNTANNGFYDWIDNKSSEYIWSRAWL